MDASGYKRSTARSDGRANVDVRPLIVDQSLLEQADGSARVICGETSVLCAVYGPHKPKYASGEVYDKAIVQVTVQPPTGAATSAEKELAVTLTKLISAAVFTSSMPRSTITVAIQVLSVDGSLLAAMANAASLALMDAGV